jgi:hypothetical protein
MSLLLRRQWVCMDQNIGGYAAEFRRSALQTWISRRKAPCVKPFEPCSASCPHTHHPQVLIHHNFALDVKKTDGCNPVTRRATRTRSIYCCCRNRISDEQSVCRDIPHQRSWYGIHGEDRNLCRKCIGPSNLEKSRETVVQADQVGVFHGSHLSQSKSFLKETESVVCSRRHRRVQECSTQLA